METLTSNGKISVARELTIKAMENGIIAHTSDPKKSAENVVIFYQTILNTINTDITASHEE